MIPLNIYVIVFRSHIIQVVKLFHVYTRLHLLMPERVLIIARVYGSSFAHVYASLLRV